MKKSRFTEVQITFAPRQTGSGTMVPKICRRMKISETTFYRWRKRLGGIDYRRGAPWIARRTRNPNPGAIVWVSKVFDGRRRDSMDWIELEGDALAGTISLTARVDRDRNRIDVTAHQGAAKNAAGDPTQIDADDAAADPLTGDRVNVLLNDHLVDLSREVTITCNGERVIAGMVTRDANTLLQTLVRRGDPDDAFPVRIPIILAPDDASGQ